MKRKIALSFENDLVKVVYAEVTRSGTVVEKTLTFDNDEFDRFLPGMPEDEFVVVQNFEAVYQDIISLPPAKERFLRQLVQLEIKKRVPDLKGFSFFYVELREVQREGKRSKDVFFLAVESSEVQAIIDRLARAGKVASGIYANVLPLSFSTGVSDAEADEAILGVLDIGTNKTIFLTRDQKLCFVRVAQSDGRGIDQNDIENINMTIAYCRQVLRINPSRVVFPDASGSKPLPAAPVVPVSPAKYPSTIVAFNDTLRDYITPLSTINHIREIEESNLLPDTYRDMVVQRKLMAYCILVLGLLSFIGLGYIGFQWLDIAKTKTTIESLRRDIGKRQAVIGEFEGALAGLQKFSPSIEIINTFGKSANIQDILVELQDIATEGVDLRSIIMKNQKEAVTIELKGVVRSSSYAELQSRYEKFLGQFKRSGRTEVTAHKLELNDRGFTVNLKWKI